MESFDHKVSPKKIEANRKNSRHSTGPRTPAGKRAVRFNALKHGLLAQDLVISGREKPARFRRLLTQLQTNLKPVGILEDLLVEKIAVCIWRLRRVLRSETEEIAKERNAVDECRQLEELGVVPGHPAEKGSVAAGLPSREASERILRYEGTLEQQFYRALKNLDRFQQRRKGELVRGFEDGDGE